MPCMMTGASGRDRATMVGDEERAALQRDVLEPFPLDAEPPPVAPGRRAGGRARACARCDPSRRRRLRAPGHRVRPGRRAGDGYQLAAVTGEAGIEVTVRRPLDRGRPLVVLALRHAGEATGHRSGRPQRVAPVTCQPVPAKRQPDGDAPYGDPRAIAPHSQSRPPPSTVTTMTAGTKPTRVEASIAVAR